jgi:hypothetical protein
VPFFLNLIEFFVQQQLHQQLTSIKAEQLQPLLQQRFKYALHFHQLLGFLLLLSLLLLFSQLHPLQA